ncbi:hypothetical protein B0I72DRAFT_139109 [Yarrowia lipolytica]|jgi:hypothetical protein|uniref:YALI0D06171p n=2 Tax=Yarrowia lipolytica TaxID=4952 RepID=Q6CA39_YARLI|nr:YALI0D06171p [Yarrowia lipolytica CLIB122]AOW03655.1 hypothetical protein YALI1_D07888g [Yarrowia lipolytica]KAB8284424.1 hypothetical protein BKA91DRAFT_135351 [Yarrowia lipolytica]KAE8172600.1 hypothetical protein BKA90DRAFT_136919 [Yarrowia lipolytica]KAJ8054735.1 hypothetical protein LXG23DRAFT_21972 [Yarrowia lipolytica]QNP97674.1 Hypothetical protein YALI2_D00115g [Yarrowia lipolytica]|eukprot:XP_502473.1 YALI0D06171p [Yarrowia lipolytica CLIB122]
MYFFVKNTETPASTANSTILNLNDELTVPDPKLGLVATYARDGHGYRKEDDTDSEDVDALPKDEETGYDMQAELVSHQTSTIGNKTEAAPPSLWSSLAQLARMASGSTETQTPSIALEIGYPNVEDKKGYKLNLGLVKVALYTKSASGVGKPRSGKAARGLTSRSRDTSPVPGSNRWVVRMPQAVDATRLRVYPNGQVTGNYEYALKAFGLKIGVGLYRPVNAYRYRIDRYGVRRTESS